jgi:ATP-binding cassette subfamily B protein
VTHDISETAQFDRVLVVVDGRIVEDGVPAELARGASRYRSLLDAELSTREWWRRHGLWRQFVVEKGTVVERF